MDFPDAVELDVDACLGHLRGARLGRVATSIRTIAIVLPVPIVVLRDRVVFPTHRGSPLDRAVSGWPVTVQAEGELPVPGGVSRWTVLVSGITRDDEAPRDAAVTGDGVRWNATPFTMVQGWQRLMAGREDAGSHTPGRAYAVP